MHSNKVSVNILATDCNMTQYCPAKVLWQHVRGLKRVATK